MAPSAVLERIRKLEKQGIIEGYEVRLDPERFGREMVAFVLVEVANQASPQDVGPSLARIAAVQEVHFVTGPDRYLVKLRVSGPTELGSILRGQIRAIAAVRSTHTAVVLKTFKETARIPIGPPGG